VANDGVCRSFAETTGQGVRYRHATAALRRGLSGCGPARLSSRVFALVFSSEDCRHIESVNGQSSLSREGGFFRTVSWRFVPGCAARVWRMSLIRWQQCRPKDEMDSLGVRRDGVLEHGSSGLCGRT
jgi:hypothetical protein